MSTATDTATIPATVYAQGGWLPDVGDLVAGSDGEAYRVLTLGQVCTSSRGLCATATLELADWSGVSEDDDGMCSATL